MKTIVWVILVLASVTITTTFAVDAKVSIRLVDEDGVPIPGISVTAKFEGDKLTNANTDTNGLCTFSGQTYCGELEYGASPSEFYLSQGRYKLCGGVTNGNYFPWNPVVTTVVRRVVHPIAMYAKVAEVHIPSTNKWFGYDLMAGDWVQPIGCGSVSDLVFRIEGFWGNYRNNDSTLRLAFSNQKDGLIAVNHDMRNGRPFGSVFILPREAPLLEYQNVWNWRLARKLVNGRQDEITNDMDKEGRDYLFRIRSTTNEEGVVTNAIYGKIHGNFEFAGAAETPNTSWLRFLYYLNPTVNDRNLEFDPQRNLFQNLRPSEQVNKP